MIEACSNGPSHNLRARCLLAGPDLVVVVDGGDSPHVGAVAMASPRPSLRPGGGTSADVSVLCRAGHKEDDLARQLAKALAAALDRQVVVCAGMHWDGLDQVGLALVMQNAAALPALIVAALAAHAGTAGPVPEA
ncbi:prenylated flavin chaperone LpdD [Desulfarculus baarsii]